MILLGLTGSIGMGKSTVAKMFRQLGVPVFDADAVVHTLQGPNGQLLDAIEQAFPGTTGPAGVDRGALGSVVLGDPAALRRLEQIVHPAVGAERSAFCRYHRAKPLIVDDVPLLFEGRRTSAVDAVLVVSAPAWKQRKRVLARPGMTATKFEQILARQVPDSIKRIRADFLISTGGSPHETKRQVRRLVACLRAQGIRYCRACVKSSSTPKPPV